ncbi:MAG: hypothetical protein JXA04_03495 [Gammaproteobacteria bacterium]|nr:hypothetical protein [Gammaproteobacteria bacterium]
MVRRLVLAVLLIFFSTFGYAAGIDIRLGNEAAQFEYLFDSDSQIGIGGADVGAALFFNENDDYAGILGVMITGSSAGKNRALQFGAGARLYAAQLDRSPNDIIDGELVAPDDNDETIAGVAIGGKVSYIFPSRTPMAVSAELFYAPDIVSFGDNKNILDAAIRFELEIAPSTRLYVGYRLLEAELEYSGVLYSNRKYKLDDSAHLGVRFSF